VPSSRPSLTKIGLDQLHIAHVGLEDKVEAVTDNRHHQANQALKTNPETAGQSNITVHQSRQFAKTSDGVGRRWRIGMRFRGHCYGEEELGRSMVMCSDALSKYLNSNR
jgi:hypothetical protein